MGVCQEKLFLCWGILTIAHDSQCQLPIIYHNNLMRKRILYFFKEIMEDNGGLKNNLRRIAVGESIYKYELTIQAKILTY